MNRIKELIYVIESDQNSIDNNNNFKNELSDDISNDDINQILEKLAREAIRDKPPSIDELEQKIKEEIKENIKENGTKRNSNNDTSKSNVNKEISNLNVDNSIITRLIDKGYLKHEKKWLTSKGFFQIGNRILINVMKSLGKGNYGIHETKIMGNGSIIQDTTKMYEMGNDMRFVNVTKTLLNSITRLSKLEKTINFPIKLDIEDFEEYETTQEVRTSIVYCIDLSSTMRYSKMYAELNRIEAAKRALWSLYILNKKFFPSDSIYVVGFGSLASKINPIDIPFLITFDTASDFLHYTNYEAAFRLSKKILQKNYTENKRIVLITDGHPSACFINNNHEKDRLMAQRPYSHFYIPNEKTLELSKENDMRLEYDEGDYIYLCYRYRQVDQYIGQKTIDEAKKCKKLGISIDTIMVSEEDSLLSYVNDLEKNVKGRSYYIHPENIDKVLLNDYLLNKKQIIK